MRKPVKTGAKSARGKAASPIAGGRGRAVSEAPAANSLNKLKRQNRAEVLELLRANGPLSIAAISERIGLSKVTVTKCLDFYLEEGVVVSTGKGESTEDGGKRPNLFAFNPDYRVIFCVKIDEVHLLTALTNLKGEIIASHSVLYDSAIGLDPLLKSVQEAFHLLMARQRLEASRCIGAAVGWLGVIDRESGVCFTSPHFPQWGTDIPLRQLIADLLPEGVPVHLANWVHYHAYGEVKSMGKRADRFFVISTEFEGVNGGLVIDGKIYRGVGSLSGEIGHMIVDTTDDAEVCMCGGKGCLEAAVSPRRILSRVEGHKRFEDILRAANLGDGGAGEIVAGCAGHFAVAINNIMQICDPGLILIQGEFSAGGEFFRERVLEKLRMTSLLGMEKTVRIEYSTLGTEGAIVGAGLYVADNFFATVDWP